MGRPDGLVGCFDKGRPCFVQNAEVLLFRLRSAFRKVDGQFMAQFATQQRQMTVYYKVKQSDFKPIARLLTDAGHSFEIAKNDAEIVEFTVKKV